MEKRQLRGLEIVKKKGVKESEGGWLVKSESGRGYYRVSEEFACTCPDFENHKAICKHSYAVRYFLQAETPQGIKIGRVRLTYPQAWSAYNAAQTSELTLFDELLKDLVKEIDEPTYTFGRPTLPLREQVFCSIQKVYSQLSSRRAVSLFGNAEKKGQIKQVPNFNQVSTLLKNPETTALLMKLVTLSASPMKAVETEFAVDSTGFKTTCFTQYAEEKYKLGREHKWLKAHACVGVKTNVVTSVEITEEYGADCPQFPVLVQATANGGFQVKEVSADKAYLSRDNFEAVNAVGGQAYIPFKSNSTGKSDGSYLWRKAFFYFNEHAQEFYEHYHKRSNVESTFSAIKKKFGDTLKSKNKTAQVNELLCKIIAHNIVVAIHEMHELGIAPKFI